MSDAEQNKTENDYLELGEVFKETIKKKDKQMHELKDKYVACFKLLMMCYTIIRMSDGILSDLLRENPQLAFLVFNIEYIRGEVSQFLDKLNDIESDNEE